MKLHENGEILTVFPLVCEDLSPFHFPKKFRPKMKLHENDRVLTVFPLVYEELSPFHFPKKILAKNEIT